MTTKVRVMNAGSFLAAPGDAGDVALLVDGENLSFRTAPSLLTLARRTGRPRIVRVYGRSSGLAPWLEVPGFVPVLTDARPQSADIRLAIDAVTLALGVGIAKFVIGSCDVDFAPLALHLREHGCSVIGAGSAVASDRLRAACCRYEVLEADPSAPASARIEVASQPVTNSQVIAPQKVALRATGATNPKLWTLIKQTFAADVESDGWLTIKQFRQRMARLGQEDSDQNWRVRLKPYSGACEMQDQSGSFRIRLRQPAPATP